MARILVQPYATCFNAMYLCNRKFFLSISSVFWGKTTCTQHIFRCPKGALVYLTAQEQCGLCSMPFTVGSWMFGTALKGLSAMVAPPATGTWALGRRRGIS